MAELDIFLLGRGVVGSALLAMLKGVQLLGISTRTHRIDDDTILDALARSPFSALVDCTAADGHQTLYRRALERGIHVVTANKKPLVESLSSYRALHQGPGAFRYETTCGAGLPIIGPLQDLVRTGDDVRRIEGSFSGTLGFLCGELSRGVPLSRAVTSAKELGYTEPHPRDDLSGLDVARKALILAREVGLPLELRDVELQPFVPAELLTEDDASRFLAALTAYDQVFSQRVREHAQAGRVLRYLAEIDVAARKLSVAPRWVDASHGAFSLKGTESFVSFTSERYLVYPLRIQGPGAGAAVTAAGVLGELLRLTPLRDRRFSAAGKAQFLASPLFV